MQNTHKNIKLST